MKKPKKEKVFLYSYFAEKMSEHIEEKPDMLSFQKARWVLGTMFRVPDALKPIVIHEMIEMGLLEQVPCRTYRHKLIAKSDEKFNLAVKSRRKILENTSKLYHEAGLW